MPMTRLTAIKTSRKVQIFFAIRRPPEAYADSLACTHVYTYTATKRFTLVFTATFRPSAAITLAGYLLQVRPK